MSHLQVHLGVFYACVSKLSVGGMTNGAKLENTMVFDWSENMIHIMIHIRDIQKEKTTEI